MSGRERLEQAWDGLFFLFPDYRFDVEVAAAQNAVLLACGSASATHATSKKSWRIPGLCFMAPLSEKDKLPVGRDVTTSPSMSCCLSRNN